VIIDDKNLIEAKINEMSQNNKTNIIICTGGTGLSDKDVTIEAVQPMLIKEISSFSPLFAKLSYAEVGSVALVSRAMAGIIKASNEGKKAIFCLPGSPRACKLAMEKLILKEAGHIVKHLGD